MAEEKNKLTIRTLISWLFTFLIISFFLSSFVGSYLAKTNYLEGNVAVIDITGEMFLESSPSVFGASTSASATQIIKEINKAKTNPNVKAVIFNINSPGGSGVAAMEIAQAVENLNKTKVAIIREIGASAAYWVAASTDYIIANPLSFVGSIGVTASSLDYSGLIERYNISYRKLTSGENKDIGTPFRKMTNQEEMYIQTILNEDHDIFQDYVVEKRNLNTDQIRAINTSLFFSGSKAKELNLIDALGGMNDAEDYISTILNISVNSARFAKATGLFGSQMGFSNAFYMIGKGIGDSLIKTNAENQFKVIT